MSCKQDGRCPLKLENFPETACPLAVQRLKALRYAGRELTEDEENQTVGCKWAISHQLSRYCWFAYAEEFMPHDKALSDMEIAHLCSVSIETVKKVEKKALIAMKESDSFQEISRVYGKDKVLDDKESSMEYDGL